MKGVSQNGKKAFLAKSVLYIGICFLGTLVTYWQIQLVPVPRLHGLFHYTNVTEDALQSAAEISELCTVVKDHIASIYYSHC